MSAPPGRGGVSACARIAAAAALNGYAALETAIGRIDRIAAGVAAAEEQGAATAEIARNARRATCCAPRKARPGNRRS